MATRNLDELFVTTLKDIYDAEKAILRALPKMARAAQSEELKDAFMQHRDQTQGHVERLQQVFDIMGKRPQGQHCEAIEGMVKECEELLDETKEASPVRDAGLIACAQAVEHYEMARYGTLAAWAKTVGKPDAAKLLQATLDEEKMTDKLLNKLAGSGINSEATRAA